MSDILRALKFLREAGLCAEHESPDRKLVLKAVELMRKCDEPHAIIRETLDISQEADQNRQACIAAVEAAENLERIIKELLEGHAALRHLESLHRLPEGAFAVCRTGNQVQELPIHPEVDLDLLEGLAPWEYVRVRENVVVGAWSNDLNLWRAAHGEIVDFKEYADPDHRMARVSRQGGLEEVVDLCRPLQKERLAVDDKLVLHRDRSNFAIATLPRQVSHSRFEVPLASITATFDDLAGMDHLAERFVMDVLKRIVHRELGAQYGLEPLRGALLISRKPGMGKTTFVKAFAKFLSQIGEELGFDVVLHLVPPNAVKSKWHGEDSRIVREDLFGAIRARFELPRERPLFQLLVLDEIDSLGRRPGAGDTVSSSAQADALESFLVELDGFVNLTKSSEHESHLLAIGMSNRPDRIDDALKRPGRLGDLVLELDDLTQADAEDICAVYGRNPHTPWQLNGTAEVGPTADNLITKIIRPAIAVVYPSIVCCYYNDSQRRFDVTAGEIMAGAHYREAMNKARNRAAERKLLATGNPAVTYEDVVDSLLEMATNLAQQMASDPRMLVRQLDIQTPVTRVEATPRHELDIHRYVRTPV